MKNAVRIGKVKLKSGGSVHLLPIPKRGELSVAAEHLSTLINDETQAVVFITIQKDGSVNPNACYEAGFATSHLLGMLEQAKVQLLERIWPTK